MKNTTILFIQGGGEGAYEVDHKLVVNLQEAMKGIGEVATIVPFAHLSLYEKTFPQATFYKIVGRGHQLDNDLAEVAADIRRLI